MKIRRSATALIVFCLISLCIQTATASKFAGETGPIFIRADGTVEPTGAPIRRNGDVYTLMNNVTSETDGIVIEKSSITFDGSGYTVQGGTNGSGFYLYGISNVTISNARTMGFRYGIYLESTSRNVVSGNDLSRCTYDAIGLHDASNNTISSNSMEENSWSGIGLYFSWDNNISENYISDNLYGIISISSQRNLIFHNNFVANTDQISSDGLPNTWDNGYPSGGNYWSNYNRTDLYYGPQQNQPGSDGIGDTPYTIDVNNVDNYPLTKLYGGLHDIGLTKGPTTKTVISQGRDLNVTIIIVNYGFTTETFNAAAYFDTTQLVQTQITLTSRSSTSLSFILNTTDLTRDNHTITAYTDAVQNETATTDNTLNSWVTITFTGDVNGDGRADMKDVAYVAKRFGSNPSSPLWDPNADLNDDDRVDMKDIAAVARNFGKTS